MPRLRAVEDLDTEGGGPAVTSAEPTRARIWREICERYPDPKRRTAAWIACDVIAQIPDAEWRAMHAGTCGLCGAGARLYPAGWRCDAHAPGAS